LLAAKLLCLLASWAGAFVMTPFALWCRINCGVIIIVSWVLW